MTLKMPVFTQLGKKDVEAFLAFGDNLRADHVLTAQQEAVRLAPYFGAFSEQLKTDAVLVQAGDEVARLSGEDTLASLFNVMAERTGTTMLSEIVIAPHGLLRCRDVYKQTTQFTANLSHNRKNFGFGFMQFFTDKKARASLGSVSVPLLTLDDYVLKGLEMYAPNAMLHALQTIATAGNHDMLHHYTSTILNTSIASHSKKRDFPKPIRTSKSWRRDNFTTLTDSDPGSFESWFMLNHQHVHHILERGAEGMNLAGACEIFFDELERIARGMAASVTPKAVHETVDHLGTVALYTMMRYMPLDDPILTHAIDRLRQVDPTPEALLGKRDSLYKLFAKEKNSFTSSTIENYKAGGTELMPARPDYAALKKLEMILIAPWIAHLLSPAQSKTNLDKVKDLGRIARIDIGMLKDSAATVSFGLEGGDPAKSTGPQRKTPSPT